jgi:cell wall-associated NlpC family hydrolase
VAVDRLEPGDLVFFGSGQAHVTHVGLMISAGNLINAPTFGKPVRVDGIGNSAIGATRPVR